MKIAKIERYFDAEGNYHGPADHKIMVNGEEHDLYEYAKQHNIQLPGSKVEKPINIDIDIEKKDGNMGQPHDEGSAEEHGNGDSEGSE